MVKLQFFLANSIFTPIFKILVRTLCRSYVKSVEQKILFLIYVVGTQKNRLNEKHVKLIKICLSKPGQLANNDLCLFDFLRAINNLSFI